MKVVATLILAVPVTALDPVRPGALIRKVGDMIIVNQSVRIVMKLENVTYVRDNLHVIKKGLHNVADKLLEKKIRNGKLEKKVMLIQEKVTKLENNFLNTRNKRGIAIVTAIGALTGLGITNIGLQAHIHQRVNTLEYSFPKIDDLQTTTENIEESIMDIENILEEIIRDTSIIRESLDIFMLLDQIYIKTMELQTGIEQLIQDLVLANTGSVISTLLPITRLMKIVKTAKMEWNFQPFYDIENVALYYPPLSSYLNGTSVIIDIPFSPELMFNIFILIQFTMKFNDSTLTVDIEVTHHLNYILSTNNLKESLISNDNLWKCKRTNLDLYLCPATYFTLNEALSKSCAASLVKNVSIFQNCHFKEVNPMPKHETA